MCRWTKRKAGCSAMACSRATLMGLSRSQRSNNCPNGSTTRCSPTRSNDSAAQMSKPAPPPRSNSHSSKCSAQASVKAGLATKALDRLASEDRRQAYEAFSLLSLVIKGGATELILQVVEQPGELGVRLAAARLLALQGGADAIKRLRRVALGDGAPEKL